MEVPILPQKQQKINYWTTGKRWFLEPINPKWSFILRAGLDIGENGWHLSYNGSWMTNKITGELFLTKNGFSQSITVEHGLSQWKQGTCSEQKGNEVRYWFSGNRWFLEPQPSEEKWIPPAEGELLWLDPARYQTKLAWGKPDAYRTIPRTDETKNGKPSTQLMRKEHGGGMCKQKNGSWKLSQGHG